MIATQNSQFDPLDSMVRHGSKIDTIRVTWGPNADAVPAICEALAKCRSQKARRLVLPPGTHHLYPAFAREEYLFISNNDEGLKRVAFFLDDFNDFEVDGQGCLLVFHGFILPFVILRSANITIRNLRIDWERPFHTEATVVDVRDGYVDLEIPHQYPHKIEHGKLVLTGEEGTTYKITNALEFDAGLQETAFKVLDNYDIGARHRAEEIAPGRIRFYAEFKKPVPQVGNILALIDEDRHCPAVAILRSSNVSMEKITLHHAGGMGFIGQLSSGITLRHCTVAPSAETGRIISLRADATHFVCCRGHILLEDCEFSHQLDDAGNFHNVFTPIVRRVSPFSVIVQLKHFQQKGLEPYEEGHFVEFIEGASLSREGSYELARVEVLNKDYILLEFTEDLPDYYGPGWAAGSLHWVADVTVRRTKVHSNRARGYLVTSGGRAVFVDNYFHNPGAAILVEGDASYWYEAGAVKDLVIRNNVFENCNYGVWGRATIDINPRIKSEHKNCQRFHHNICVEGNTFITFHPEVLRADCVDGLIVRSNTIRFTTAYPGDGGQEPHIVAEHCSRVEVSGNEVVESSRG